MRNIPFALIIRGASGSGKTTVARKISVKYRAIIIEHDMFLFRLQRYKSEGKEGFELANHGFKCCFDYTVKKKRNLVLEGAFMSVDRTVNVLSLTPYVRSLKKNGYRVIQAMLMSSHKEAKKRIEKREHLIPVDVYRKIKDQLRKSIRPEEILIDTSRKTSKQINDQLVELIEAN